MFLLVTVSSSAQQVYYPLSVGDRWQYFVIYSPSNIYQVDCTVSYDTIMPNGKIYAALLYTPWSSQPYVRGFQRQEGNQVLQYSGLDSTEYVLYDFDGSPGDTVSTYFDGSDTIDVILASRSEGVIFGATRTGWQFTHLARHMIDYYYDVNILDSIGVYQYTAGWDPYYFGGAIISGRTYGTIVSVPLSGSIQPTSYQLHQNYPNPFNSTTTISFELMRASFVTLDIFNVAGQRITTLIREIKQQGLHRITFNASSIPSGVYFYRMSTEKGFQSRVMILAK